MLSYCPVCCKVYYGKIAPDGIGYCDDCNYQLIPIEIKEAAQQAAVPNGQEGVVKSDDLPATPPVWAERCPMEADFTIHGGWGNHVSWSDKDFSKINLNTDTVRVNGHMPITPKVGDTLMGEFEKSFIKFEFVSVEYCGDPPDMFFGEVKAISQEMKASNNRLHWTCGIRAHPQAFFYTQNLVALSGFFYTRPQASKANR